MEKLSTFNSKNHHFIIKGGLGVVDQFLFSGTNFILNILLARWMAITEFGLFAFAATFLNLFYQLQNGLVLEPMSVIGTASFSKTIHGYIREQIKIHFLLFGVVGIILLGIVGGIFFLIGNSGLGWSILLLGILAPVIQLPWLIRRIFYVLNRPILSVLFSTIYGMILIFCLWVFFHNKILSTQISFGLMCLASVLATLITFFIINKPKTQDHKLIFRVILFQNWEYGKWMLLTGIIMFIAGQVPIYFAGIFIDTESAGVIKAIQNFILPMSMSISTITAIALPTLSKEYSARNVKMIRQRTRQITLGITAIALLYEVILIFFSGRLELLIYNGIYHNYVNLIPLWGLLPIFMALTIRPAIEIRVTQKPKGLLITAVVWALITVIASFIFSHFLGILGLSIGACVGYLASFLTYVFVSNGIEKNELHE